MHRSVVVVSLKEAHNHEETDANDRNAFVLVFDIWSPACTVRDLSLKCFQAGDIWKILFEQDSNRRHEVAYGENLTGTDSDDP